MFCHWLPFWLLHIHTQKYTYHVRSFLVFNIYFIILMLSISCLLFRQFRYTIFLSLLLRVALKPPEHEEDERKIAARSRIVNMWNVFHAWKIISLLVGCGMHWYECIQRIWSVVSWIRAVCTIPDMDNIIFMSMRSKRTRLSCENRNLAAVFFLFSVRPGSNTMSKLCSFQSYVRRCCTKQKVRNYKNTMQKHTNTLEMSWPYLRKINHSKSFKHHEI